MPRPDRKTICYLPDGLSSPGQILNVLRKFQSEIGGRTNIVGRRHPEDEEIILVECPANDVNMVICILNKSVGIVSQDIVETSPSAKPRKVDGKTSPANKPDIIKHLINPVLQTRFSVEVVKLSDVKDINVVGSISVPRDWKKDMEKLAMLRCLEYSEGYQQLPGLTRDDVPEHDLASVPDIFGHQAFRAADTGVANAQHLVQEWIASSVALPGKPPDDNRRSPGPKGLEQLSTPPNQKTDQQESQHERAQVSTLGHPPSSTHMIGQDLEAQAKGRLGDLAAALARAGTWSVNSRSKISVAKSSTCSTASHLQTLGSSDTESEDDDEGMDNTRIALVKNLTGAIRKMCRGAREFPGAIRLEVQLGWILFLDADDFHKGAQEKQWGPRLTQYDSNGDFARFTNRIATRPAELGYIFNILLPKPHILAAGEDPMAYSWSREWSIDFECVDWRSRPLLISIDGESLMADPKNPRYKVFRPPEDMSTAYIHHPKNSHDVRFLLRGYRDEYDTRDDVIQELVSNLEIQTDETKGPMLSRVATKAGSVELRIQGIRIRRVASYLMAGLDPLIAKFTDVMELLIARKEGGFVSGHWDTLEDQIKTGRHWQEFCLVPPVDDSQERMQQLQTLIHPKMVRLLELRSRQIVQGTDVMNFPCLEAGWYNLTGKQPMRAGAGDGTIW